jgi:hypothetical protein
LRNYVVCMLMVFLASAPAREAASAESIFVTGDARPPQLILLREGSASGLFGGAAAVMREGADMQGVSSARITSFKAGASSLLLPGLGQQRLGRTLRAKVFFGLETASWLSIGSFLWIGYSREISYKDYAVAYAGVQGTGYSDEFYKTIGQFMSNDGTGGYNESVRRDARDLYYPNVEAIEAYYQDHMMTGDESWHWRTDDVQRRYSVLRDGSRYAYRVALYCAVAAAALRVVSAADAVRIARTEERRSTKEGTVSLGLTQKPRGIALYLQKSF